MENKWIDENLPKDTSDGVYVLRIINIYDDTIKYILLKDYLERNLIDNPYWQMTHYIKLEFI